MATLRRHLIQLFLRRIERHLLTENPFDTANRIQASRTSSPLDIYYAYRLILGREPDAEGYDFWRKEIGRTGMNVDILAGFFLKSTEFQKRIEETQILVATDLFKLFVDPSDLAVGKVIAETKQWEPHLTNFFIKTLQTGDLVIDVGANFGWFSLLAATLVGPRGRVFAVEMNPRNLLALFKSIYVNGLKNVFVVPFAASDSAEIVQYSALGSNGGLATFDASRIDKCEFAQAVPLDSVLETVDRAHLIKIDVEGHEPHVLRGLHKIIERFRPTIVLEFHGSAHSVAGVRSTDSITLLDALGYRFGVAANDGEVAPLSAQEVLPYWERINFAGNAQGRQHIDVIARAS
jgi:FkbM family methyltransferase